MLTKLYLASPASLQNIALSLYGAKTSYERFSGKIPEMYSDLAPTFSEPEAHQFDLQEKRLRALLKHCSNYVPYYKNLLKGDAWKIATAKNLSDLVPKIKKEDILANPDLFISTHPMNRKSLMKLSTSGSTGTPLTLYTSYEARRINYAFYEHVLKEQGCSYRSPSTTIAGRILYRESSTSSRVARYDYYNNTQYLSAYFISRSNIKDYIRSLNSWKPQYIDSYPSALNEMIRLARQEGLHLNFKPKFILTSSETLTQSVRADIANFFSTSVIDHYGCTEMTVSAFSEGGSYYANPLYSVMEMEKHYEDSYSLITTGLLNFSMPLIRYEIGDHVVTKNPSNPYIFDSVEGRMDDVIVTKEGRRVGRMDPAFKGIEDVSLAQIIQEKVDQLIVKVVLKSERENQFDESLLISNIKDRTSQGMSVSIIYVKSIDKEKNGKFKSVISRL